MLLITFVIAFVLFGIYAFLKTTEYEDRATYYRDQRDEAQQNVDLVEHLCRMNLDYNADLLEDKEALCKEIRDLEEALAELEEQNVHLRGRLNAYWISGN
jgi:septal ring factor EnvC (AmiA/AmiB activator)